MKYATDMGSGAMIYMPSLIRGDTHTDIQTHTQQGNLINLLLFFQIRKGG
jgi:hypothetical protein